MSFAYGVNVIREPPVRPCRYTCGESPTESNVRPSGEIEATIAHQLKSLRYTRKEGSHAQWFTATSNFKVPTSLIRVGGPSTPLDPRTLMS